MEFRSVAAKFAKLYGDAGATQKAESLAALAENLAPFDSKTVRTFVKQHHEKATQAKSAIGKT